ncbi:MAG: patatin-like phospholipase family protein [Fuerstiella sp.]
MSATLTWTKWFEDHYEKMLPVFQEVVTEGDAWQPSPEDKAAAWELYVELRTRISSQPLHFLSGDEVTALDSLYSLFKTIRDLQKKQGPDAFHTACFTNIVLNSVIRPVTARWHKLKLEGKLAQEDLRREFRRDLQGVQEHIRKFQKLLLKIARGTDVDTAASELSLVAEDEKVQLGDPVPYNILLGLDQSGPDSPGQLILQAERKEIAHRRQAVAPADDDTKKPGDGKQEPDNAEDLNDLVGLAISGGGIRSSTFALGVLQGLARHGILKQVDVMSTVSGGGYVGSFLSTFLNNDSPECGLSADKAPFKPDIANDSEAIRSLRNNSRYMQPAGFWPWVTAVGQVAYGIVSNLIILSFLVFIAVLVTHYTRGNLLQSYHALAYAKDPKPLPAEAWTLSDYAKVSLAVFGGLLFLLPLAQRYYRAIGRSMSRISGWELATAVSLVAGVVIVLIDYLPNFHYWFMRVMRMVGEWIPGKQAGADGWSLTATSVTIANGIGLLVARAQWLRKLATSFPIIGSLLFLLLWLCGPVLFAYAYFELCRVYIAAPHAGLEFFRWTIPAHCFIWLLAAGSFVYSFLCNVNFTSLHRFYRNRLAETFLLSGANGGHPEPVERQPLSELRKSPKSTAPYHIVNAALNLPSSRVAELRGRDCDFFIFTKHYCGSPVIGYQATRKWQDADSHLDLGTALAISGAAAAPQMGMVSIRRISFLMTLLNVRMGYWQRKPFTDRDSLPGLRKLLGGPGPLYLCREALNVAHQDYSYLNLSDGGHVENLGVYELLRRRCRFIVAIDGECDPELVFPSLRQLQRFATVDLGVSIDIVVDRIAWIPTAPVVEASDDEDADKQKKAVPQPIRYSRGHFAIGKITYPAVPGICNEAVGWLAYIKLSVTGNEPHQMTDYRRRYPDAPHQTTADQVFEEDQFEAYRSLGEHVAEDMFAEEFFVGTGVPTGLNGTHLPIQDWFGVLANALYRPVC